MKLVLAILSTLTLSVLCHAQMPASTAAPTAAEMEQQLKTLVATRQVFFERLEHITEFQKWYEADQQIAQLRQQLQQQANSVAAPAADLKASEAEFKKKMAAEAEREKKDTAAKK